MSAVAARTSSAAPPHGLPTDRPLRFCMLTTFYPPYHFGGDAMTVQRLSRGLVRRGHHVTVIHDVDAYETLHTGPAPAETREPPGLDVVRLHSAMPRLSAMLTQQTGAPIVNRARLKRILADGGFDVVNFHNVSLVGGPAALGYARDATTLYMAHEHWLVCPTHVLWRYGREVCTSRDCLRCVIAHRRPPQLWRYTGYLERQIEHVDAFIALSEFSRDKHREFGFTRPMEVLPGFLPDPESAARPEPADTRADERPFFLFVGRLERIKGLDDVIPLFHDYAEADLVIAGDGEHGDTLRALAAGMPNVRFIGRLTPEQVRVQMRQAVAVLVPSVCYETFGMTIIEAFREGTPVLARRIGPFPELVGQAHGGELFSSAEELVPLMRRLQQDPAHRAALGAAGYEAFVSRWTESAVIPRYLEIARAASERHASRR